MSEPELESCRLAPDRRWSWRASGLTTGCWTSAAGMGASAWLPVSSLALRQANPWFGMQLEDSRQY